MNNKTKKRILVYAKYSGHCAYCGRELDYFSMQMSRFFTKTQAVDADIENVNAIDNLYPACQCCVGLKGNLLIDEFREKMDGMVQLSFRNPETNLLIDDFRKNTDILFYHSHNQSVNGIYINPLAWDGRFYFEKSEDS
jgi:hypothetical protein